MKSVWLLLSFPANDEGFQIDGIYASHEAALAEAEEIDPECQMTDIQEWAVTL